jgi:hypothetical protein
MKHLLMDPHFPDIVGAWANEAAAGIAPDCANDNDDDDIDLAEVNDPLIALFARLDVSATRLW